MTLSFQFALIVFLSVFILDTIPERPSNLNFLTFVDKVSSVEEKLISSKLQDLDIPYKYIKKEKTFKVSSFDIRHLVYSKGKLQDKTPPVIRLKQKIKKFCRTILNNLQTTTKISLNLESR